MSPVLSRNPIPNIPITITTMAIAEPAAIVSPRTTTAKREQIAPDVFSIGSEMDSSINLIPKNENAIEII